MSISHFVSWTLSGAALLIVLLAGYYLVSGLSTSPGSATDTQVVRSTNDAREPNQATVADGGDEGSGIVATGTSERMVFRSASIGLPLAGSAPTSDVLHTVAIEDIRRGCLEQDCIPSVDDPRFITVSEAKAILPPDSIGIALSYEGVERYYPFPMLETHELVNDTVAGDPLLVSYCPLCGTGIVFRRTLDGIPVEFGVSGMLWQSNLLMYNRADDIEDRNLWSQVLGEAVVGDRAGERLPIVPSDIMRFTRWADSNPGGEVLMTGSPRDPYGGAYYDVASNFQPDFNAADSPLPPMAYVYGIEINDTFKAYPQSRLPVGTISDTVAGETLTIVWREDGTVTISDSSGRTIPDVEGFWFSWAAAHPETDLFSN